jgi:hypothetical protein
MQLLRTGLGILLTAGAVGRVHQIASSAVEELDELGHPAEASEVRKFLSEIPGASVPGSSVAAGSFTIPVAGSAHPVLPASCPKCGALVRTDEIEWIDPQTAECAYCGTPIRPEEK